MDAADFCWQRLIEARPEFLDELPPEWMQAFEAAWKTGFVAAMSAMEIGAIVGGPSPQQTNWENN